MINFLMPAIKICKSINHKTELYWILSSFRFLFLCPNILRYSIQAAVTLRGLFITMYFISRSKSSYDFKHIRFVKVSPFQTFLGPRSCGGYNGMFCCVPIQFEIRDSVKYCSVFHLCFMELVSCNFEIWFPRSRSSLSYIIKSFCSHEILDCTNCTKFAIEKEFDIVVYIFGPWQTRAAIFFFCCCYVFKVTYNPASINNKSHCSKILFSQTVIIFFVWFDTGSGTLPNFDTPNPSLQFDK